MIPIGGYAANAIKIGRKFDNVATTSYKNFSGTTKATGTGVPNSSYLYTTSNNKPISKYFYNDAGKVEFQIDFKSHNMGGVHGHFMSTPGSLGSGHLFENHIPFMLIPKKYW